MRKSNKPIVHDKLQILYDTQPQGGVSFKAEFYNRFGDGYKTTIAIVDKPSILQDFWINDLVKIDGSIVTIDYFTDELINYKKEISDSVQVTNTEMNSISTTTSIDELETEMNILRQLNLDMKDSGETIKFVKIKIHVQAVTLEKLEERVNSILLDLSADGYTGTVFLNEQKYEWQSLFISYEQQRYNTSIRREGLEFPSEALGIGFGHNQTALNDPSGSYFGVSRTGGSIYWDMFYKDPRRLSYNMFVAGTMGSGKSTLLKKTTKERIIRGDYVYGFDKSGEFAKLIEEFDGIYLKLDGSNGMINLLQVYPTVTIDDEESIEVDIQGSFDTHISMFLEKMKILNTDLTPSHMKIISDIMYRFYIDFGIWDNPQVDITQLENEEYPTIIDLYKFNKKISKEEERESWKKAHDMLEITLTTLINQYKKMFVGHTTFPDITTNQLVFFDVGNLSGLESSIFDCQFHTAMNLIMSSCMKIGRQEKYAFDNNLKAWDDLIRCVIVNDECQNTLNVEKSYATTVFSVGMSEARKFLLGFINATQFVERMFPKTYNVSDPKMAKAVNTLQEIVGLCQYKVILKQAETSIPALKALFGSNFTDTDYEQMPYFTTDKDLGSQGILSILGDKNINMYFKITEEENKLFTGGA